MRVAAMLTNRFAGIGTASKVSIGAAREADHHVLNQFLWIERLAGGESRAGGFAFAALHAGVKPQQLVPGEILGFFHAQGRTAIV